jgi:hypothetical protein
MTVFRMSIDRAENLGCIHELANQARELLEELEELKRTQRQQDVEVEVARAYWLMQLPHLVVGTGLENQNARNKLTILLNATKGA